MAKLQLQNLVLSACLWIIYAEQTTYTIRVDEANGQSLLNEDYTNLNTLSMLDESVESLPLPFPFKFFGIPYTNTFVSSNGILSFSNSNSKASAIYSRNKNNKRDHNKRDHNKRYHGPDSETIYNGFDHNTYIAALHRESRRTHLASLVGDIRDLHDNELIPHFRASIRAVHEHLLMICIESPTPEALTFLREHQHVLSVGRSHEVHLSLPSDSPPVPPSDRHRQLFDNAPTYAWGLDRIDQPGLPLDGAAYWPAEETRAGGGVDVYVVDTGLDTSHGEFAVGNSSAGRNVSNVFNYYGKLSADTDNNGHGTHCAGTIGGINVGVAPAVNLFGVKVLDGQGAGTVHSIIAGLDYIASLRTTEYSRHRPIVVSMSLGGFCGTDCDTSALNIAVNSLSALGVVVVVAAGNTNDDACLYTPASAETVITVGAVTDSDALADFSCTGACVDLLAPGQSILSACPSSVQGTKCAGSPYRELSGTSMAAPHVAGVASLWIAQTANGGSYAPTGEISPTLKAVMQCNAREGVIVDGPGSTANLLLQVPDSSVASLQDALCDVTGDCASLADEPEVCSGHGQCFFGGCRCEMDWAGELCEDYVPTWLTDPYCCDGGDLGNLDSGPFSAIALLWTDLNPESPLSGPILYGELGRDQFAIVFREVAAYGVQGCSGTVEVVLNRSGLFELAVLSNGVGFSCGTRSVSVGVRGGPSPGPVEYEQIYGPAARGVPNSVRLSFTPRESRSENISTQPDPLTNPTNLQEPMTNGAPVPPPTAKVTSGNTVVESWDDHVTSSSDELCSHSTVEEMFRRQEQMLGLLGELNDKKLLQGRRASEISRIHTTTEYGGKGWRADFSVTTAVIVLTLAAVIFVAVGRAEEIGRPKAAALHTTFTGGWGHLPGCATVGGPQAHCPNE